MTKYTDTEVSAFLLNSGYPLKQIKPQYLEFDIVGCSKW